MPREISSPIPLDPITVQGLTSFYVVIGHTGSSPDPAKTFFEYRISNFDSAGKEISAQTRRIYLVDIPTAFKNDLKAIRNKVLIDAENQGILKPGTDSEDL